MRSLPPLLAALLGGLAAGCAVAAIFLFTDAGDNDDTAATQPAPSQPEPAQSPAPALPTVGEVYRQARRAVFVVEGRQPGAVWPHGPPSEEDGVATGTGFAIAGGRIITNQHVVDGAEVVAVRLGGRRTRADAIWKRSHLAGRPLCGRATPPSRSAIHSAWRAPSPPVSSPPLGGASPLLTARLSATRSRPTPPSTLATPGARSWTIAGG